MKFYKKDKAILALFNGEIDTLDELNIGMTDASLEKHVPVYFVEEDKIDVHIGELLHPMENEHYIMWIALETEDQFIMQKLKPNEEPKARFPYIKGSKIYAYCNLHGLWKCEVE